MSTSIQTLVDAALEQWESWDALGVTTRGQILDRFADALDAERAAMVRWQIDNAMQQIGQQLELPGPTGEANVLFTAGRGLFVLSADENAHSCAMVGQLTAALMAGNVVIVLGHNNLIQLLTAAGCPQGVAQTLDAPTLPESLISQPQLAGVAITADDASIAQLNTQLAARNGNLAQLISETDLSGLAQIASPYYLLRFITERTRTDNTTAVGGNATLLELGAKEE